MGCSFGSTAFETTAVVQSSVKVGSLVPKVVGLESDPKRRIITCSPYFACLVFKDFISFKFILFHSLPFLIAHFQSFTASYPQN